MKSLRLAMKRITHFYFAQLMSLSHFTWRAIVTAFRNCGKWGKNGDSEKQETRSITVFFQNTRSTTNDTCKQ